MLDLKNKRIAVFGLGGSGLSAVRLLVALGADVLAINSGEVRAWAKKPGVLDLIKLESCLSENDPLAFSAINNVEQIILSPGIPRDHELLKKINHDIPIIGEIELAFQYLESVNKLKPIIGITGTNGKTTTTTFLGEMIKADGRNVFVGGNIGVPFCDYAFDIFRGGSEVDYILLELSSFQLESIHHFHVNVAILLNIFQNHGERYSSIQDYAASKFHITNKFTNKDLLIYPSDSDLISKWANSQNCLKESVDSKHPKIDFDLKNFKLPGMHNLVNLNFILIVARYLGLSRSAIQSSIDQFGGVHHRIEYVSGIESFSDLIAYNDAKSTNWDATITAVRAMEKIPGELILVIGGKKRGHGDSILPYLDYLQSHVKLFYLIGEMANELEAELAPLGVLFKNVQTLEAVVKDVQIGHVKGKKILLFSPAFPSFDQYKNYSERGDHFVKLLTRNH